ncbi:DMT family transporter [Colwellia sp. 4_MG-2023]|uniref:DMT family transporter n=1 Tax=unclassified Colwellia TaxID=196834 RepID=UPI001C0A156D|nr:MULTISPECIES: DMT family transporter [unclassified Colwellia]MBU2924002.1 DMT family transporter [Colwellia sp. C2M11]MDO6507896.1 DMT family transporter [Colwellia sp. 5_MG-2023]MDO6556551.1 DMT family transporter [Colwellia sp. 4_MG-2023]MDO6653629.1 DMT family transporter [Colwellia sp. 3_MG-2023]MDO6666562.1 DMT family transporter [Colwellia sp. 2_MG-2023]
MTAKQQSLWFLHSAVLLFGGTALFSKLIGLPALDITVYRTGVAAIVLFILLTIQKKKIALANPKDYGVAILLGAVVGIHWVTYFASMQMAGVTVGVIAFFTYPVITVFLEPLLSKTKSRPKVKDIVIAVIVLIGIFLLIPEINLGNQVTVGIIIGVISAFFFALRNVLHKNYFSHYSGPHTMLYQTLVAFLMLGLFVDVPPLEVSTNDWLLVLLAGAIFTAMPHALFASSLRHLSATTAGLISCLQPLYGSVLAFLLLNERVNIMTVIGGMLVISAALFETWSVSKER